jgi:hypothetical protein
MAVAIIAVVIVGPRRPWQSATLGNLLPSAICRHWQSAALGDPPPHRYLLPPLDLPEAHVKVIPVAPHN